MKQTLFIVGAFAAGLVFAGAAGAQPAGGGMAAVRQACAADITKFCPDAKPGPGGGMRECMMTHHADFSSDCQAALAQMRAARQQSQAPAATNAPQ